MNKTEIPDPHHMGPCEDCSSILLSGHQALFDSGLRHSQQAQCLLWWQPLPVHLQSMKGHNYQLVRVRNVCMYDQAEQPVAYIHGLIPVVIALHAYSIRLFYVSMT